ncbi:MAG: DUF1538 domain-containing protein [Tissierellia bacterium]|nr:DUF1538 domain-containing protein [Tissierellia bacterium]
MNTLTQQFKEVLSSVLPVTIILLLLNFTIAPIGNELVVRFIIGAVFIIIGLTIFLFGTDMAIQPIGEETGLAITKKKNLSLLIISGLILGFFINIAEPDLMILANQVQSVTGGLISQWQLLIVVSIGIGIMVAIGLLRIVLAIPLNKLLTLLYIIIFGLVSIAPESFIGIAFDSGGATTGSMTVPFILALGLGVASSQGGKKEEEDSFGLVGISSSGPMLAVLTMAIFSGVEELTGSLPESADSGTGILAPFLQEIPVLMVEIFIALLPIIVIFFVLQFTLIKLSNFRLKKILKGLIYTYVGFLLFLAGVNAGFMEAGLAIGYSVASIGNNSLTILIGFILGFVIIAAEPAVYVLNEQIEDVTSGHIKKKSILLTLSIGVAIAVALSMARILIPGMTLKHLIIPGYIIAIVLTYFTPKLFVGIAFDSGGVASGPMSATFILAFAQGVADATPGADVLLDGFGVIAMVALTPLIAIQILGLIYKRKSSKKGVE